MEQTFLQSWLTSGSTYVISIGIGLELITLLTILKLKRKKLSPDIRRELDYRCNITMLLGFILQALSIMHQNLFGVFYQRIQVGTRVISSQWNWVAYFWIIWMFIVGCIIGWIIINKPFKEDFEIIYSKLKNTITFKREGRKNERIKRNR